MDELPANSVVPESVAQANEKKAKITLAVGAAGIAGCITIAVFALIGVIVLGIIAFFIWAIWLFLTNPYGVTF